MFVVDIYTVTVGVKASSKDLEKCCIQLLSMPITVGNPLFVLQQGQCCLHEMPVVCSAEKFTDDYFHWTMSKASENTNTKINVSLC